VASLQPQFQTAQERYRCANTRCTQSANEGTGAPNLIEVPIRNTAPDISRQSARNRLTKVASLVSKVGASLIVPCQLYLASTLEVAASEKEGEGGTLPPDMMIYHGLRHQQEDRSGPGLAQPDTQIGIFGT
jgi:hypothetical protein